MISEQCQPLAVTKAKEQPQRCTWAEGLEPFRNDWPLKLIRCHVEPSAPKARKWFSILAIGSQSDPRPARADNTKWPNQCQFWLLSLTFVNPFENAVASKHKRVGEVLSNTLSSPPSTCEGWGHVSYPLLFQLSWWIQGKWVGGRVEQGVCTFHFFG